MMLSRMLIFTFVAPALKEDSFGTNALSADHFSCSASESVAGLNTTRSQSMMGNKPANNSYLKQPSCLNHTSKHKNVRSLYTAKDDLTSLLGGMSWQTLDQNVPKCLNVLMTMNTNHLLVRHIIRFSYISSNPLVIVDFMNLSQEDADDLVRKLWSNSGIACRGLLIDFTAGISTNVFSILESSKLWQWGQVRAVVIGGRTKARWILLQEALRNIPEPLYISLDDDTLERLNPREMSNSNQGGIPRKIRIYGRCLYCNSGSPDVLTVAFWRLGSDVPPDFNPFPDQRSNFQGHLLKITSMPLLPFSDLKVDKDEGGASMVTFNDCVDGRIFDTMSSKLNFSYEVNFPWDKQWGFRNPSGNWTGMIGTVQYEEADCTTTLANSPGRNAIVDHSRVHPAELMAIVSLKPQLLPRYLVIIRPFTADVWIYLCLSIFIWGATLWLFQKIWSQFSGEKIMGLSSSIFYSWAVILEDPPREAPANLTGQMLVGWWLSACLIITTFYKSGLVANLAVENKEPAIDTFADVVERPNWRWALKKVIFSAHVFTYIKESTDPVVQEIHRSVEAVADTKEALQQVSLGGFSFIHPKSEVVTEIAFYHTDNTGWSPFYISKYGHKMFTDLGWGLRKGAPFGNRFKESTHRLNEAGLVDYWTQSLMKPRGMDDLENIRRLHRSEEEEMQFKVKLVDDQSGVLRMSHVMGVFLFLIFGYGISSSAFMVEICIARKGS